MKFLLQLFKKSKPRKLTLGEQGEQWAATEYTSRGYVVVGRNKTNTKGKRMGELDLVVTSAVAIIFVEVKTRTANSVRYGGGVYAVHTAKQQRLVRAAHYFLGQHPEFAKLRPQIDVCLIDVTDIDRQLYSVKIVENSVEDLN